MNPSNKTCKNHEFLFKNLGIMNLCTSARESFMMSNETLRKAQQNTRMN